MRTALAILVLIIAAQANSVAPSPSPAPSPSYNCNIQSRLQDCVEFILRQNVKKPAKACCSNLTSIAQNEPSCLCDLLALAKEYPYYVSRGYNIFGNCSVDISYYYSFCGTSAPPPPPSSMGYSTIAPAPFLVFLLASLLLLFRY